jgi:hypothetical protein
MNFETFWQVFPRKLNKAMALKAYNKAVRKGFTSEAIITGATDYKQWVEVNGIDTPFICYPATFINQERFDNNYGSDRRSQPAKGKGNNGRESQVSKSLAGDIAKMQKDFRTTALEDVNGKQKMVTRNGTRFCYDIPEGMTHKGIMRGLIDAVKPCADDIGAHITCLLAFKTIYDADALQIEVIKNGLIRYIKDYPEIAVVLALNDMRLREGKWFPEVHEIIKEVKEYAETIYNALGYFANKN